MQDLTGDVRDYLSMGRNLWPKFTRPLRPDNIQTTLLGMRSPLSTRDVLSRLGQKFLPIVREELKSLGQPRVSRLPDTSTPVNVHFLIVSAYICQTNHPGRDKQLFVIEKNGRRSSRKDADDATEPGKPRSFPAERMYSIYVSLFHLHGHGAGLGSLEFFGLIESALGMEMLQRSRTNCFTSSVTKEEAFAAASIVEVPIDQYVK